MARKTIRQRLMVLKRRFPRRTKFGFLHRTKADLSRRHSTIFVYSLIYSERRGHSILVWNPHRRGKDWQAKGWNDWLNREGLEILSGVVIESINANRGTDWIYRRLIGFHGGELEPQKPVLPEKHKGRKRAIHSRKIKRAKPRRNKANVKRK